MAENEMGNLISNYGNMSLEELGGSLLQRQSDQQAAQAKEDKKSRRFQQAMAVLTTGQALFKNATKKRLKELDSIQAFNMQDNAEQAKQINVVGRIGKSMPSKEWFEERKDMDTNGLTKELLNDQAYGPLLEQNLSNVVDTIIKQGVPENELLGFTKGTSEYETTFHDAMHTLVSGFIEPSGKAGTEGKRNFEVYEDELRELLNDKNLDDVKLYQQAIAMKPNQLNIAEKRYYQRLKNEYSDRGFIQNFKDIFTRVGIREEEKGRVNIFRNINRTNVYGTDMNDILTTLNIEGPLITSIDKSLAAYRKSPSKSLVAAKSDPELIVRSKLAIETFQRNLGNSKLYNKDNTLKAAFNGGSRWKAYTEDFTDTQMDEFSADVAGLSLAFKNDKDFAEASFIGSLEKNNEEVTPEKVAEFKQKVSASNSETYRLNLAIAVASQEGFTAGGGIFFNQKPEYYQSSYDKTAAKYQYDRFKGSIPAILGEGIAVPSETESGNYEKDNSWDRMDEESKKIVFDNQLKYIEQSSLSDLSKNRLMENLFDNIGAPEFNSAQEYLKAYPADIRSPQYKMSFIAGPMGGEVINIPKKKTNTVVKSNYVINDEIINLQQLHLEEVNKDGTPRFTYTSLEKAQKDLNELGVFVLEVESDGNYNAANPKSSAKGGYQFTKDTVPTAVNYLQRKTGPQPRFDEAIKTGDTRLLTKEDQTLLFYANILEKPGSDILINNFLNANNTKDKQNAAYKIYTVLHHTVDKRGEIDKLAAFQTKRKLNKYFKI